MRIHKISQYALLIASSWGFMGTGLAADAAPAPEPTQEASFDLLELRVKGNTLLEKTQLERAVYPYLGLKKTIATVEEARKNLEKVYQDAGFQTVAVDIPEQDVKNGVVYLQVVEGKVSRLRVKDSRYFSLDKIKAGVPELAEGKVPNMPKMQAQIAALGQESADRKITPIMRAGDTPGTLEVDLKVKDNLPLHGRLELNGRNVATTSLTRLAASMHYDNLWQKMHSVSLMYQVAPEVSEEVDVWAATYMLPLPQTDAKLALYTVHSSSDARVANVGDTTVLGIGEIYGARFVKPLPVLDRYSHSLTLGVDYKDFLQDTSGGIENQSPVSYLPFMVRYGSAYSTKNSLASFELGINFSVRGLGNDAAEFSKRRPGSQTDYAVLLGNADFSHNLPFGMEVYSRFTGQLADSPLINNEQMSLGGMESVRGYFETQALADDGMVASLELRSPHLLPGSMDVVDKLQAIAFVDGGLGWIQNPLADEPERNDLASAGLGLRFKVWQYFEGVLDLGFPLLKLDQVEAGDPKLHFLIASEF
jgi:hemolysin activation/secretion protein